MNDNIVEVKAGDFRDDGFVVQMPHERTFQWSTNEIRYGIVVSTINDPSQLAVAKRGLLNRPKG